MGKRSEFWIREGKCEVHDNVDNLNRYAPLREDLPT